MGIVFFIKPSGMKKDRGQVDKKQFNILLLYLDSPFKEIL